ncbi:MAG: hypothetical protein ACHREM_13885 [Polyangiales bacterium]
MLKLPMSVLITTAMLLGAASAHASLFPNTVTANALTSNALTSNSLTFNALTSNSLSYNGQRTNGQSPQAGVTSADARVDGIILVHGR